MSSLLVIICTHNPKKEYLLETVGALRAQTLLASAWDLLVVDNASSAPIAGWLDLSWHSSSRIVREETLGTAHARHRALREAQANEAYTVLFVDDDNILAPDYLQRGLELGEAWPQIGCWGGQLLPRYETPPAKWAQNYLKYLAITPLVSDRWSNTVYSYDGVPPTAGCFVRPSVWQHYLTLLSRDPRRLTLGARGKVQLRGEDTDLVLTAIDLGLGIGRFAGLVLEHIIPASRLSPHYIASLVEGTAVGIGLLEYIRYNKIPRRPAETWFDRRLLHWRATRLPEPIRSIRLAELRGRATARETVLAWQRQPDASPKNLNAAASHA